MLVQLGVRRVDANHVGDRQEVEITLPRVEDVVSIGDELMVVVTEIDRMGRVNLSRRAAMERHMAKAGTEAGVGAGAATGGDDGAGDRN